MPRPTIAQTAGRWPRNTLVDPTVADSAIAMLDEHAAALDALSTPGITPVTSTFAWAGATVPNGGADTATFTWSPSGLVGLANVVDVSYSAGLPAGVILVGSVVSANTVQATFLNLSGAQQVLAAGNLRFIAR